MISRANIYFLLIAILFHCNWVYACNNKELSITTDLDDADALIEHEIKESFFLEQVTVESDVHFDLNEFFYLTNLKEGSYVSSSDIKKAVAHLIKKNKFSHITIKIEQGEIGKKIHIILAGFWTLHKVKFHGLLVGKDAYRHHYLIDPGDFFDETKHQHALEDIRDVLKSEGYFNGTVESSIQYDQKAKAVTVTIVLNRGDKFTIGDIQLELLGDKHIDDGELTVLRAKIHKLFLHKLIKNHYTKHVLDKEAQALKRYLSQKGFLHTTITLEECVHHKKKRVNLIFTINLHTKKEFIFFGNSFFSNTQLLESILLFGRSAWLLPISILLEEIVQAYHKKGFWNVVVESDEEENRSFFLIKEGARASIKKIELKGVQSFNAVRLAKRFFIGLVKLNYFDADVLQQAIDALIAFYLKEGFLDAKVLQKDFELLDDDNHYKLSVMIDEGKRSYVTSISIDQFNELEHQGPFVQFAQKKVQIPFNNNLMYEQRRWLINYFQQQGYMYVEVKPELTREEHNVSLIWKIDTGPKVRFGKTIIIGNLPFPFEHIIRELPYKEGHIWDKNKLKQSLLTLKELEVFEDIQLYPAHSSRQETEKAIILRLHKDDPFELRVRAGLGFRQISKPVTFDGLTYKVGGTFIAKNPFNCADQFRIDTDFTRSNSAVTVQYRRPWIFDLPIKMLLQGYSINYQQPGFRRSTKSFYKSIQHGFLIGLTRKYEHGEGGTNIGIELMETTIRDEFSSIENNIARALNFDAQLLNTAVPFLFLEPTILLDYTDHKLYPTKGMFTVASLKGMFPIKAQHIDAYFIKLLIEQSFFFPIRSAVFALRLRFGHIFHRAFDQIMPPERFYLGGANSIRSYETDFTPPLGIFKDKEGKKQVVPQGGKSMINLNVELRLPLFEQMSGVIFQDLGVLNSNAFDFQERDILAATGFGLRYHTPIGPLRFDIGWKWSAPFPLERSYAWFLSFGHAF